MSDRQPGSHDEFFRATFADPKIARAFCRHYVAGRFPNQLDVEGLKLQKGSFVDPDLRSHLSDMLYTVPLAGTNRSLYIYILIEHKSRSEEFTMVQLLRYMLQIWCMELEKAKYKAGFRLPPILPLILHHGEREFTAPTEFSELIRPVLGMEAYVPKFGALLIDLAAKENEELPESDVALYSTLSALQSVHSPEVVERAYKIFQRLAPKRNSPEEKRFIEMVSNYLFAAADYMDPEKFEEASKALKETGEGIMTTCAERWKAEGIEKGKLEGKVGMLLAFLNRRCGPVPEPVERALREISEPARLDELVDRAADCKTIDEFAAHLKR